MTASWYERYLLPHVIDCACGLADIRAERAKLIPRARGRVLEIGIGTGHNLPHYRRERIEHLCGVDPATDMHPKAQRRMREHGLDVELLPLSAERVPAPAASFDTVVCTFTLCSIPEPLAALAEMRRVLKPQGELLFCEHGRAPETAVQRWQDRLTPIWKRFTGGCHLNRDTTALLSRAGFRVTELEQHYLPGPRPVTWVSRGIARTG